MEIKNTYIIQLRHFDGTSYHKVFKGIKTNDDLSTEIIYVLEKSKDSLEVISENDFLNLLKKTTFSKS